MVLTSKMPLKQLEFKKRRYSRKTQIHSPVSLVENLYLNLEYTDLFRVEVWDSNGTNTFQFQVKELRTLEFLRISCCRCEAMIVITPEQLR
jgi:hypothetical protein